ncbi:Bug family tripartite tricarboxylate transporter substrate binding protein [Xylophilus sp.]|uniref:Bug family tripartite tricarboxylate transporter substrate binding protein n=1 Tax=Xylophilus sp. TaxID=2653893 RepID=UPI0013B94A3B|nr:tripartite tricarboxylate transporter substrate binding protein [Xylophilus sp.]KAF1047505.1 MAG: hypothetical protein GAK38_01856 [Xylophilus sp.]
MLSGSRMASPATVHRRRFALQALAIAAVPSLAVPIWAQGRYPERPVTLVVPFAPGGNIDFTARVLAEPLGRLLGQPVIVDNRPGAGGVIGAAFVARAKSDGYTLLLANSGPNAVANAVSRKVPYDGVKDFTVVGGITTNPAVLTVSTRLPAANFAEFVAYAHARSGGASVGTAGNGSFTHLVIELVRARTGLLLTAVPYKGTGPAAADLMGGQLDAMVDQVTTAAPLVTQGRVKAIAQLGPRRSHLLPNVPTLAEQGFPDIDGTLYTGLFAPAGLPTDVTERLAAALEAALRDPSVRKRYHDMGADVSTRPRADFARYAEGEARRWAEAARASHVSIDE